jgi:hypothetical protein
VPEAHVSERHLEQQTGVLADSHQGHCEAVSTRSFGSGRARPSWSSS